MSRPLIVCLCGSTRFIDAFRAANLRETLAGKIVLSIGCDTKSDTDLIALGELTEEAKARLDELHKRKIDLADEVLILNVGGYVGKSTLSEIIYADRLSKPLRWLEPMQCPCCKGRGGFDDAEDSHECALCHGACVVGRTMPWKCLSCRATFNGPTDRKSDPCPHCGSTETIDINIDITKAIPLTKPPTHGNN